jgi:molybdopterin molybdotransferase
MISLSEAKRLIDTKVASLSPVDLPLLEAIDCALACDLIAPIDVPQFAGSIMDGIALRRSDLKGDGPWRLPIQKTIAAGDSPEQELRLGQAVKIMTGAPLPRDADLVIPVEELAFDSGAVIIKTPLSPENFTRSAGDDIKKGQKLFGAGDVLKPADIGVLGSLGMTRAYVIPKPRIALFSTGSEIVEPGAELGPGQIYDSNNIVMRGLLAGDGHCIVDAKRVIQDKPAAISRVLQECLKDHDLVITTGGVSMGDFDLIPQEIKRLGGEIIYHKIAVKPGKPNLLANFGGSYLVGLPGNPVSVIAGYHLFGRRVIWRLMGKTYAPRNATATIKCDLDVEGDRLYLVASRFREEEGKIAAYPSTRQKSGRLSSVIGLDGFVFVDGGTRTIPGGTEVYCEWL